MSVLSRRDFLVSAAAIAGSAVATAVHLERPRSLAVAAAPECDLICTAITIPSGISAGQLVTFGVTIKNQGTAATPTGKEIGVGFLIDGHQFAWSGTDFTALAAGATVNLRSDGGSATGGGTWAATAGTHTITAVVNDVHRFAEISWSNNAMSSTFTVATAMTKPVNTVLPVISGSATVGSTLTVSEGTWT